MKSWMIGSEKEVVGDIDLIKLKSKNFEKFKIQKKQLMPPWQLTDKIDQTYNKASDNVRHKLKRL